MCALTINMYICTCIHGYVYARIHVRIHVYAYTRMYVRITRMYVRIYAFENLCLDKKYVYMSVYTCVCIYTHQKRMYVHIAYVYVRTYAFDIHVHV